ncbi:MAG: bacillithiol biosynthesis cysteine-adding enzyme BshC [Ignavibacteriales bacterium]|nr:bacillithiol biosynthesis cysteine-adding enzyme BshC [Ignavibacteriales bacterium]
MNCIPFNELQSGESGFSRLFVDYIDNYSRVKDFFIGDFRDKNLWQSRLNAVTHREIDRSSVAQVLLNQNRDYHCGIKTLANIDLLLNENTVAVVTGQQVGLFTGPLYTLYKILTTLKLTEQLSQQYPEYNFVPIFWIEGEDHDIEEVSSFSILNASNELQQHRYPSEEKTSGTNVGAVGSVHLDESIGMLFSSLHQSLLPTEYSPKVFELFETAYQKGMTFSRAFIHLVNVLLEDSGLIFFDPHNPDTKKILKPIFEQELNNISHTCQLVITQSELLEKQYHAQVKPRAVNLFLFHNGGRYAIEPREQGFSLKGTRRTFSKEEMLEFLNTDPNLFSPNVILRPICQDYLFPTLAYVAGPSEVAYFAQFKLLYENFDIPEPIIYPRCSATVVEDRIQKIINKYGLQSKDFFTDIDILKGRITATISDFKVEELFSNTFGTVSESLTSLKGGLESIDPTLVPAMESTLSRMQGALNGLKEKTLAAQVRQHEISLRQLDKVSLSLFPNSNLQEREMNIVYFLNKYGLEFLRWLRSELVLDKFMHQIINLE